MGKALRQQFNAAKRFRTSLGIPDRTSPHATIDSAATCNLSTASRPTAVPVTPTATVAPRSDPTFGGLVPAGYPDPGAYVTRLEAVGGTGGDRLEASPQQLSPQQL